ncbi:lantibiotic dehydratase [Streptomyces sp. NPDC059002]|uniref:lantibiotic dehydratase n=1 Tax=Streptomyces sp. NPDC059002 TaxID=3346690 RepID=UPI0036846C3F
MTGRGAYGTEPPQDTVLLRTAGLPMRLWCAGGSPGLFRLIAELERTEGDFARMSARLADVIGTTLVPHPQLTVTERRLALSSRRRLYRGRPLPDADHRRLVAVARRVSPEGPLAQVLLGAHASAAQLRQVRTAVTRRYEEEKRRLAPAGHALLMRSPVGRRALRDGTLPVGIEVAERLAAGRPWTDRQMRKRADYLWRMIARGAVKVTPRGWLGHVAVVGVADGPAAPDRPFTLTDEVATDWRENLQERGPAAPTAATRVSFNPFLHVTPDRLEALALQAGDDILLTPVRIRRTPLVNRLYELLRGGALPLGELEAVLAPPSGTGTRSDVLRQFLVGLHELGVLQLQEPVPQRRHGWQRPAPDPAVPVERVDGGYLDVYRRAPQSLPAADLAVLRASIGQALRLHALIDEDAATGPAGTAPPFLHGRDRPVLDILRDRITAQGDTPVSSHIPAAEWPEARSPGSGYARLLDWLDRRIDGTPRTGSVDISTEVLDRFGAPEVRPDWPLDCLVRPLPDRSWALDIIAPAGVYDARFVGALELLHGPLPHVEAYRDFLRRLDRDTGVPSVELLFPALSRFAANAVRRPLYTGSWTGDPDLPGYCEETYGGRPRFVPLDELTARWTGGRVVISDRTGPVRPLYHSARNAPRPWDQVASLLLRDSPQHAARRRRLRHSLTALPKRDHVPRITVAGSLVLSAAQWRLPVTALPTVGATELDRAGQLTALRARLGLPRWVFLSAAPGADSPLPCDLESLGALPVLERMGDLAFAAGGVAVAEEMLPSPVELTVADLSDPSGGPVTAELMVRIARSA